jgi:hypothetical protein
VVYCYECPACGVTFERTKPVARVAESEVCDCGAVVSSDHRNYAAEGKQVNGMSHVTYPYVSKGLCGTPAGASCQQVDVTRNGITMKAPLIESAAHERNLAAKFGLVRE